MAEIDIETTPGDPGGAPAAVAVTDTDRMVMVQADGTVIGTAMQLWTYISGKLAGALALLAPLDAPLFTGNARAPTRAPGDSSTGIATTAFVQEGLSHRALDRLDPTAAIVHVDEFLFGTTESGEMGDLGWAFTSGAFNMVNPEDKRPGMAERASGAVAGTVASTYSGGGGTTVIIRFDMIDQQTWIIKPKTADTDYDLRFGFFADMTANPPANGVYFEKLAADAGWHGVARVGGAQTRTADLAAFAADWFKLKMRRVDATTVAFSVNGGAEVQVTTNVPIGTNVLSFGFQIIPTTANARSILIDYFSQRLLPQAR